MEVPMDVNLALRLVAGGLLLLGSLLVLSFVALADAQEHPAAGTRPRLRAVRTRRRPSRTTVLPTAAELDEAA
jgi:hypothetical protein